MDKERETGDGTLDRFSHYPYAPTVPGRNLPPVIGSSEGNVAADASLPVVVPNQSLTKRNQINLSSSYNFPPGFVDPSDDLNRKTGQTVELPKE